VVQHERPDVDFRKTPNVALASASGLYTAGDT